MSPNPPGSAQKILRKINYETKHPHTADTPERDARLWRAEVNFGFPVLRQNLLKIQRADYQRSGTIKGAVGFHNELGRYTRFGLGDFR